jgi:hypothetical protein
MTPEKVIELFQEPKELLRLCYLHIGGGATRTPRLQDLPPPPANGQAEMATFSVTIGHQKIKGFVLRGQELKDRAYVKILKLKGPAKNAPDPHEFNAYYVPMVQTSDVRANTSHYTLPTAGLPNIMLTSRLSGCTFGVGSDGNGAVLVSHVQPDPTIKDDNQRRQDLENSVTGGFQNLRGLFAIGGAYEQFAAVIGRRKGTAWKFYLQPAKDGDRTQDIEYVLSRFSVL